MQNITAGSYTILFNSSCYTWLQDVLQPGRYSKIFILTDSNTYRHCLPSFLGSLATEIPFEIIETEPGEELKSLQTCNDLWLTLTELEADRKSLLINLGGGVVTDMGGFTAAVYKRGIDFINVPTTLLAMTDASVGGKTGVNLNHIKNQVGIITNPVAVLIDTSFLETLPQREMRSGLAEMLKHGLIADREYWDTFKNLDTLTTDDLAGMIHTSITIKNTIVQQDPFEKNVRKKLNYGHTLGHAIEAYCLDNPDKETLLHGEAVAAGMVLEAYLSKETGLLPAAGYYEVKYIVQNLFDTIVFTPEDIAHVILLLQHDKKNEFNHVNFVLLNGIGNAIINQEVAETLIYKAFEDYMT